MTQISYDQMKDLAIAKGTVPDGWFGDREFALFCYDPNSRGTFILTEHGYFRSVLGNCIDMHEANYYLRNHPDAKRLYKVMSL